MTDAIDFDGAVIKLAREHFYLGERGPGRTLQAAAPLYSPDFLRFTTLPHLPHSSTLTLTTLTLTLQATALHLRHSLDSLVYHPTTLTILSPLTPLRPCTLYTYCGRYCRPPPCTYSTQ